MLSGDFIGLSIGFSPPSFFSIYEDTLLNDQAFKNDLKKKLSQTLTLLFINILMKPDFAYIYPYC